MEARGHSYVNRGEFYGRADIIKYDESRNWWSSKPAKAILATLTVRRKRAAQWKNSR